jgi:hypothetical protein
MKRKLNDRFAIVCRWVALLAIFLPVLLVAMTACSGRPKDLTAQNGQEVTLTPGQSVSLTGEPLKVQFVKVVNDSRCPKGVQCIWAGQVTCLVEVTYQNVQKSMVLTQMGDSDATGIPFVDYVFNFTVDPYPEAQKTIKPGDYRLELTIVKGKIVAN